MATFMGVVGVVRMYYPDKPSVHKGYEGGLDRELGGGGAVLVSQNLWLVMWNLEANGV